MSSFTQNTAVAFNERLVFTASYNMSGLMTDIAQVTMETTKVSTSKSTLMRLKCTAVTYSKWDNFFKIRDLYESYVNPKTLTPYLYKRDIDEGGYYKFMQYKYNQKSKTIATLMRKKNWKGEFWEKESNFSFSPGASDLVATLYQIRNLDIASATAGDTMEAIVIFDNEETSISITLLGEETIKTNIGNKRCYKLAFDIKDKDLLKGENNNLMWFTADEKKLPVFAKFAIAVGNGELRIDKAEGI
jgi:hypothetical protein